MLRLKKGLCQVQTRETHLNCCVWRLMFMDPLTNVCMALVTASGVRELKVGNPHGTHMRCQLLKFAEAQTWAGVRKEGTSALALPGWPWVLDLPSGWGEGWSWGAPCQCGTEWRTTRRHPSGAARPDLELPPCSPGMQEGSVGAVCCPFPGNEVLASISSDSANTNPERPQLHISIVLHSTTISTTALGIDE